MSEQRVEIHEAWSEDIACNLDAAESGRQLGRWADARAHLLGAEDVAGGVRMRFAAEAADAVRDVVARESRCCGFLRLSVDVRQDEVVVEITGGEDAQPVIRAFAGAG